jgi:hypothetical protein
MHYGLNLPNGGAWGDARTLGELARLADAGATWWVEYIEQDRCDLDAARACIAHGPLRID